MLGSLLDDSELDINPTLNLAHVDTSVGNPVVSGSHAKLRAVSGLYRWS